MKKLLNFTEFVNESIGAALGNPVKFTKLKNNAKKYQQVLVQKSLNDVDFEKKKAAAKDDPNKSVEVLRAANKAKNQALADKASGISDRMDQLATTDGLKAAKTLAKSKAKIAAAETSLKAADTEETKQLKLRIKELGQDVNKSQQALKDYETDAKEKEEDPQQQSTETEAEEKAKAKEAKEKAIAAAQKEIDDAQEKYDKWIKTPGDGSAKHSIDLMNLIIDLNKKRLVKAQLEENDDEVNRVKDLIAKAEKAKEKAEAEAETEPEKAKEKAIETAQAKLDAAKEAKTKLPDDATDEQKDKADNDIKAAEDALAKANGTDNNSVKTNYTTNQYIGESVADRFRHLMFQKLK